MEEVHVYPVFICDDEPRQITIIDQILGKAEDILANNNEIRFRTSFATNFEDAVKYFDQNKDEGGIYFLDIELGTDKNQNNGFLLKLSKNKMSVPKLSSLLLMTICLSLPFRDVLVQ